MRELLEQICAVCAGDLVADDIDGTEDLPVVRHAREELEQDHEVRHLDTRPPAWRDRPLAR